MPTQDKLYLPHPTTDLLSRKWAMPVVSTLGKRILRYNTLESLLPGITQKMLTETLRSLERHGILRRRVYPIVPPQVEYQLTPAGLELLKLTDIMTEWIDVHNEEVVLAQKSYDRRNK